MNLGHTNIMARSAALAKATGPARFSVIIVNFNGGDYLQAAVSSLARQTHAPYEVFIVDNGSSDGSPDRLDLSGLPQAVLMHETENHGFARGNNLAAVHATGTHLAFLNPDATAALDWLARVAEAITAFPDTEMFASAQIASEDQKVLDGAGDSYFVLGFPWRGGFARQRHELPQEGECFSACGASAVISRTAFVRLGGFEERFFCYCEDVDLGFRLRAQGGRCRFLPNAQIAHTGSAISGRYSDFTVRFGTRNRVWTYIRNMPGWSLWLTLPGHLAATVYFLLRALGKPHFNAMLTGLREALDLLPEMFADRRELEGQRKVTPSCLLSAMCFDPLRFRDRRPHVFPGCKRQSSSG